MKARTITTSDPELYVDPLDNRYNSSAEEHDKEESSLIRSTSDSQNSDDEDKIPLSVPRQAGMNVSVISLASIDQMTLKKFDKQICSVYSNRYKQEFWVDNCVVYQYGGENEYKRPLPSQVFEKGQKIFCSLELESLELKFERVENELKLQSEFEMERLRSENDTMKQIIGLLVPASMYNEKLDHKLVETLQYKTE
ncbi:unnamed protein product [Didymodactylos carnosus]|uniref:Uncharacterized protein n=1 Tax=Didymodactylos carnosus TaxID=1234261 RepID=A0A814NW68_9BILA|nr:unnamed protein product [Didymodactylos carnosus]CAF3862895.1 unnamed protein product [Didymodactylos carnosus]